MIGPVSRALSVLADLMDPEQRTLAAETLRGMDGDPVDHHFFCALASSLEQLTEDRERSAA